MGSSRAPSVVSPTFEAFAAAWERGEPQMLRHTYPADTETPVSVFLKLTRGRPYSSLFESVEGGVNIGRYSFISTDADLVWRAAIDAEHAEISLGGAPFTTEDGTVLESLRRTVAASQFAGTDPSIPMAGGLVGFLGYETVRGMERLPDLGKPLHSSLPQGWFFRPRLTAVFDRVADHLTLVAVARPEVEGTDPRVAWDAMHARLDAARAALDLPLTSEDSEHGQARLSPFRSNLEAGAYEALVERGREYIAAGDIFQVVLSQRFTAETDLAPFAFYRALRRRNPAPFLFFLQLEEGAVAGSSPEVLVRVRDREVTVRPLAGTRPRGRDEAEDAALERELLADPKERAEHLMLLDLGRNDVGRVSEKGSVAVPRRFVVERYSRVMHISSTVTGRLAAGLDALDALIAAFPAGTLSGAPKVRAMEIIEELEPERRGLYAGAVGYFGADGGLDSCIVLRTAVLEDGRLWVQAGAGIVADSVPASEQRECLAKADALFLAAEEAAGKRGVIE